MSEPAPLSSLSSNVRGRGAAENPTQRFAEIAFAPEPSSGADDEVPAPATRLFRDTSRAAIAWNDSPDLAFSASVNPYRGCEHGCIYCYARPTHEYLGFSAGLDFESRIMVKEDAPELLRRELASSKWQPQVIMMSGVTDCYQPIERTLKLTRRCLEVLAEFRNPVGIVTKSALVVRDVDVLQQLARFDAAQVIVTITTLDAELAGSLEPRAARPAKRLETIARLREAAIPVGVNVAPVIPGLTDHEIPAILGAAARAGARSAGWQIVRLPHGVKELFESWLERHAPERRRKVLARIREMRGGRLNEPRFGVRMRGEGPYARQIEALFHAALRRERLDTDRFRLSAASFRRPGPQQGALFRRADRDLGQD